MASYFDSICRLCMKVEAELQSVFTETNNLCSKIKEISPKLQIFEGDGLPAHVCEKCAQQVDIYYNFRLQCEESDTVLRHYLSSYLSGQEISSISDVTDIVDLRHESVILKEEIVDCLLEELKQDLAANNASEHGAQLNTEGGSQELGGTKEDSRMNGMNKSEYKCESCSEVFTSKQSLEQHHCNVQWMCQICMKVLKSRKDLNQHMSKHKKEPCRICGKTFREKSYYLIHMKAHSGLGYKCKECDKDFATASSLKIHGRIHTGEKPYVCELCGESFARIQAYNYHKMKHSGIKPFQCPICAKTFTTKHILQNHMLIHTGEKPYICEKCGYACRDAPGLAHHIKSAHTGYKRPLLKCSLCPKAYRHSTYLKTHIRMHTGERPHKCHLCTRAFTTKHLLTQHYTTHTGEKKYDCAWCEKKFSFPSSRDRHVRTHTGETPYECDHCRKAFSLRRDLIKHIQKLHIPYLRA